MSAIRIKMPNGHTLRIGSQRRYIVAVWIKGLAKWQVEYRTDKLSNAMARWRSVARVCEAANLVDTVEKAVIR